MHELDRVAPRDRSREALRSRRACALSARPPSRPLSRRKVPKRGEIRPSPGRCASQTFVGSSRRVPLHDEEALPGVDCVFRPVLRTRGLRGPCLRRRALDDATGNAGEAQQIAVEALRRQRAAGAKDDVVDAGERRTRGVGAARGRERRGGPSQSGRVWSAWRWVCRIREQVGHLLRGYRGVEIGRHHRLGHDGQPLDVTALNGNRLRGLPQRDCRRRLRRERARLGTPAR